MTRETCILRGSGWVVLLREERGLVNRAIECWQDCTCGSRRDCEDDAKE